MAKPSLLETTQKLLANRGDLTYEDIAKGAGVGIHWLHKFAQGATSNPSVRRVEAIHNYLVEQKRRAA